MGEDIKEHQIVLMFSAGDFEQSMGRKPKSQEELAEWAHLAKKCMLNGYIDWDTLFQCTRQAMGDEP